MFKFVIMNYTFHVYDMFDEMSAIASRGSVKGLFKYFHFHYSFLVIFLF